MQPRQRQVAAVHPAQTQAHRRQRADDAEARAAQLMQHQERTPAPDSRSATPRAFRHAVTAVTAGATGGENAAGGAVKREAAGANRGPTPPILILD